MGSNQPRVLLFERGAPVTRGAGAALAALDLGAAGKPA